MVSTDLAVLSTSVFLLYTLGLTAPSSSIRTIDFLVMTALIIYTHFFHLSSQLDTIPDVVSYSIGALLIHWFASIDFLLLRYPQEDLYQIGQRNNLGYGPVEISSAPFFTRLRWASSLAFAPRGIGWNFAPQGTVIRPPPSSQTSRSNFIAKQLFHALLGCLLADTVSALPRPEEGTWQSRLWYTFFFWVNGNAIITSYTALSIVGVATFLSKPEDWPPLFSFWSDAWTLRRFWGRTWHQILRRRFQANAQALVRALGFNKGSKGSSYGQLYLVFLQSGILHFAADYVLLRAWSQISILGYQACIPSTLSIQFFLLHATGITIEDAVIGIYHIFWPQKDNPSGSPPLLWMLIGYVWVILFLSLTLPPWYKTLIDVGMNYDPPSKIFSWLGLPQLSRKS